MMPKKSWSDVALDEKDHKHTVHKKNSKMPKCVIGTKKYSDDSETVKESRRVHRWHVYIGNLDKMTTSKMIQDQLSSKRVTVIS